MFLGLPTQTLDLILLGALLVSICHAAQRRDPIWMLALGMPTLFCADHADLPETLVAWGCALYAGLLLACGIVLLARHAGALLTAGTLAAIGSLALVSGTADARYWQLDRTSLHQPPLVGTQIETMLRHLTHD
jgi:threonine/homoserine efflux transporter RhtA